MLLHRKSAALWHAFLSGGPEYRGALLRPHESRHLTHSEKHEGGAYATNVIGLVFLHHIAGIFAP